MPHPASNPITSRSALARSRMRSAVRRRSPALLAVPLLLAGALGSSSPGLATAEEDSPQPTVAQEFNPRSSPAAAVV